MSWSLFALTHGDDTTVSGGIFRHEKDNDVRFLFVSKYLSALIDLRDDLVFADLISQGLCSPCYEDDFPWCDEDYSLSLYDIPKNELNRLKQSVSLHDLNYDVI